MSVSLELESENGNIELTPYLNVQEGEGMDPADPEFTTKVFAHSLLKQGGTLALEDLKLREMTFPLRLSAKSKDALTQLVREINTIMNTPGCKAAWQDEGAERPTYLEMASGQLDPQFKYRQGEHNFLPCKLRLFCQPLGLVEKTARSFLMKGTSAEHGATLSASQPVSVFYGASAVRGDAPALIEAFVGEPEGIVAAWSAVSVLPNASYSPWLPATPVSGTGWHASTASDGAPLVTTGPTTAAEDLGKYSRGASGYAGSHRVLAIVKVSAASARIGVQSEISTPYAASTSTEGVWINGGSEEWTVADCGVISRSSLALTAWNLYVSSTATVSIGGLVMLPENSTSWLAASAGGQRVFSGRTSTIMVLPFIGAPREETGNARGAIPVVPAQPSPSLLAFFSLGAEIASGRVAVRKHWVNVQERTRYVF